MYRHYTHALILFTALLAPTFAVEIPNVFTPKGLDLIDVSPFRGKTITDYRIPSLSIHYGKDGRASSIFIGFANAEDELLKRIDAQFGAAIVANNVQVNANERVIRLGGETILVAVWKAGYDITNDKALHRTISSSGFPVFYEPDTPSGHVVYGHALAFLCERYLVRKGDVLASVYYKPPAE